MFNPADFDALAALVEKRYSQLPDNHHMKRERSEVLWCIHVARQAAKEYGMMAPEPAPVRLCQECGAAPTIAAYFRMCESCMRSRLLKELELAQALTEPLKHGRAMYTLPPSNTFADDLDTIARVLHTYGYITSAIDVADKAQQIRAIVAKFQQTQSEDK